MGKLGKWGKGGLDEGLSFFMGPGEGGVGKEAGAVGKRGEN